MFTGIIAQRRPVAALEEREGLRRITIDLGAELVEGLERGASVAVDGVCLTATDIDAEAGQAAFDVMGETLAKTTLGELELGDVAHIERAAAFGDEIGGHLLSGHVQGTCRVASVRTPQNNHVLELRAPGRLIDYVFPKGYVALAGASLTVVEVDRAEATFTVWLIPETLRVTTFGGKEPGDRINLEVDPQTVAIVETVERVMAARSGPGASANSPEEE